MKESHIKFIIYIRTLQFWRLRLRNSDPMEHVYINSNEIEKRFFPFPLHNCKQELKYLIDRKEIEVIQKQTSSGHQANFYRCLNSGNIDLTLLEPKGANLNAVHKQMLVYLSYTSLLDNAPSTLYFDAFLHYKNIIPRLFFIVDEFSQRVHTPVSSFHRTHRPNILIQGEKTSSLDVQTMQPLLLGKILKKEIGNNDFSSWLNEGKDIYVVLQEKANLKTRDEAKKKFFEILFGKPNNDLSAMFGASNWIVWINDIKSKPLLSNPHTIEKEYSNLAYLLQSTEVNLMFKVWHNLIKNNILFLSVHDEIIIKESDTTKARKIFEAVLSYEFEYYKLNNKMAEVKESTPQPPDEPTPEPQPLNDWSLRINELETYFQNFTATNKPIKISQCETISGTQKFIDAHLCTIKRNNGKKSFLPYLERLEQLKAII